MYLVAEDRYSVFYSILNRVINSKGYPSAAKVFHSLKKSDTPQPKKFSSSHINLPHIAVKPDYWPILD